MGEENIPPILLSPTARGFISSRSSPSFLLKIVDSFTKLEVEQFEEQIGIHFGSE